MIKDKKNNYNTLFDLKTLGVSQSFEDLSNFILTLEKQKYFHEVTLIKSNRDENTRSEIDFELTLLYNEDIQ